MSLSTYIRSIETGFPDFIHFQAHDYSKEGKHELAIAAFSWAIAFNINNSYNSQAHYLSDRGDEYYKANHYEKAMEDYSQALRINPKVIPVLFHTPQWSSNLGIKASQVPIPIYKNIWQAVTSGGDKRVIFYASRGMNCAYYDDKYGILKNFLYAIDKDLFLAKSFRKAGKAIYKKALFELKKALCRDFENYRFEDQILDSNIDEEVEINILLNEICNDEFYTIMEIFIEMNGLDVMDKKYFYALLADFLKNEFRADLRLLKCLVEKQIHKVILETRKLEETRGNILNIFSGPSEYKKEDINRIINTIYCLAQKPGIKQI